MRVRFSALALVLALLTLHPIPAHAAAPPKITINSVTVPEGDPGGPAVSAVFTVTLSKTTTKSVTVKYSTAPITGQTPTATAGVDYTTTAGTLTIPAGQLTGTITVPILPDLLNEASETFYVNLSSSKNATILGKTGTGTITDNDPLPGLSISDASGVFEGNSGTVTSTFTVTLSAVSGRQVTVAWATADGTATAGSDYVTGSGTLTFAPGSTQQSIGVTVNGDTQPEADETFFVNLAPAPVNATIVDGQGQGVILNDDLPVISINDVSQAEGDSGQTSAVFTLSLSFPSSTDPDPSKAVVVNWATADGTATAGTDYVAASGTLTFSPGSTSQTLSVLVSGDTLYEADETFFVNLTGPSNATIGDTQGQGTISNDDPAPSLSVDDVSVTEGDIGTTLAVFHVTLSTVSGVTATADYATADVSATAGSDYLATSGTLSIPAGSTSQTVLVAVKGDLANEGDETYDLNLSNPTYATLSKPTGLGTILDDDPEPGILIDDVTVAEGNSGKHDAAVPLTLSFPSGSDVTVHYATSAGTATPGSDYVTTSGTLTILAGDTSGTILVPIAGDTKIEPNEGFLVRLSSPVNAKIARSTAQVIIQNDDGPADPCQPILTVPITITTSGLHCLQAKLATGISQGAAITVAADRVVVDLGRKVLRGTAGAGSQAYGIDASGQSSVTVQNGTLRGFFTGVRLGQPGPYTGLLGLKVKGVRAVGSLYAGISAQGPGTTISASSVRGTGGTTVFGADADAFGIFVEGAGARVSSSFVSSTAGAGSGSAYGIMLLNADGSLVDHDFVGNRSLVSSTGIRVDGSAGVAVDDNNLAVLNLGIVYANGSTGTYSGNTVTGVVTPYVGGTPAP